MLPRRDGAWFPPEVILGHRPNNSILLSSDQRILFLMVWESFTYLLANSKWVGRFPHLHRITLELCQSDHRVLGHLLDQDLSPPFAQFGGVLGVPNFFHLRMMEATVSLGTFNAADIFWYPSPDLCIDTILSRSSADNSFVLMAWFLLWHALSTVGPYSALQEYRMWDLTVP